MAELEEEDNALQKQMWDLARTGKLVELRALLEENPEIDVDEYKDERGLNALRWACNHGHTECARLLIDFNADVNAKDNAGSTALMVASGLGHQSVVEVLRKAGGEQDTHASTTKSKCSDEMMLDYSKDGELSQLQDCISGGSNVNAKDKDDWTALIWASFEGH
jgi:ankyrin repeat protein